MSIYLKNNPAKFDPNPIWNDGALGFLNQVEERSPQQEQEEYQYAINSWSKKYNSS